MKIIISSILLYGLMMAVPKDFCMKKVEKNGMTVKWRFEDNQIHFKVFAPSRGWLAVGFNTTDELTGTNLIMASVDKNQLLISDRYIKAPGNHQSIQRLGGLSNITASEGFESENGTTVSFSLSAKAIDKYHFDLKEEKKIHFLLAYSESDDFEHHSTMRTSVKIVL